MYWLPATLGVLNALDFKKKQNKKKQMLLIRAPFLSHLRTYPPSMHMLLYIRLYI